MRMRDESKEINRLFYKYFLRVRSIRLFIKTRSFYFKHEINARNLSKWEKLI